MPEAETGKKSSAKWPSVKLVLMTSTVIIFSIPVALLPYAIRRVQPTAEFVFLVFAPGLWNSVSTWINPPCLFVLLNIVLVTLGLISRAPPTSKDDRSHNPCTFTSFSAEIDSDASEFIAEFKLADPVQNDLIPAASTPAPQVQKPAAAAVAAVAECRSRSSKDLKNIVTPAPVLYSKKSRLRRSTAKLSNLSRESRGSREIIVTKSCTDPATPKISPGRPLVVFEISTDVGDYYMHQHDEVIEMVESDGESANKLHRCKDGGMSSSSEELYLKAESFIGDFYRKLKMQREDSWQRLCGIYGRSC